MIVNVKEINNNNNDNNNNNNKNNNNTFLRCAPKTVIYRGIYLAHTTS